VSESKRFDLLANIMRASHFEWRRAVQSLCPDVDPTEAVKRFWEEAGKDTAAFYLKKIDPEQDLAAQVGALYVASSVAMGEDAAVIPSDAPGVTVARHDACPWYDWHKREGLVEEDQVGCDWWLKTVVEEINESLGTRLRFETVESLPAGGTGCVRRFWEESE
jgi:hypothetical protein